jgi:cytochrome c peroxidase
MIFKGFVTAILLAAAFGAAFGQPAAAESLAFRAEERARILAHGPWPQPQPRDASNRVDGRPQAVELGRRLFFDVRLSANGRVACASCHQPAKGFQDDRATAFGLERGARNTPGLVDVAGQRWYGWDGAADSLWMASVRAIVMPHEMGMTPQSVHRLVAGDAELARAYRRLFGAVPKAPRPAAAVLPASGRFADDVAAGEALLAQAPRASLDVLVNLGKALAAYQATLRSGPSPFDTFRAALERGDVQAMAQYPASALRGLRIFVGRGQCYVCHSGPRFTNGEFGDVGIPYFLADGSVDSGRHGGIQRLLASPLNLLGRYNDDPRRANAAATRHLRPEPRNFGEFKVPSLRNLDLTGPYMHDGSLENLRYVAQHYAVMNPDRIHTDGPRSLLQPLDLSDAERYDLAQFLRSLSATAAR